MTTLAEDLEYRYGGTFVSWPQPDGTRYPFMVREVFGRDPDDPRSIIFKGVPYSATQELEMDDIALADLDLRLPHMNVINVREGVVAPWIVPARRSRRGLRMDYLNIKTFGVGVGRRNRMLVNDLYHLYNPAYPTYEQALASVASKNSLFRAFSRNLWVGQPVFQDESILALGYRRDVVADIDNKGVVKLMPEFANLQEEIGDFAPVIILPDNRHRNKVEESRKKAWPDPSPDAVDRWHRAVNNLRDMGMEQIHRFANDSHIRPASFRRKTINRSELVMLHELGEPADLIDEPGWMPMPFNMMAMMVSSEFYTRFNPRFKISKEAAFVHQEAFRTFDMLMDHGITWERDVETAVYGDAPPQEEPNGDDIDELLRRGRRMFDEAIVRDRVQVQDRFMHWEAADEPLHDEDDEEQEEF